jgi:predicted metal-dependent phosphoesterase TrpH
MVARASEVGLEALVFTEHNLIWPADELAALQERFPRVKLLRGVEITTDTGDDFLIYGIPQAGLFRRGMPIRELLALVRVHQGVVVLAHPYRYASTVPTILDEQPVDGVEVLSNNILSHHQPRAEALGRRLGAFFVAASDGHHVDSLGLYAVRLGRAAAVEADLAVLLRQRAFSLHVDTGSVRARNAYTDTCAVTVQGLIAQGLDDAAIRARVPGIGLSVISGIRAGLDVRRPMRIPE